MSKHKHETEKGEDNGDNQEESLNMLQQAWNALKQSGFWLVIFTGLLSYFTYKLYKVADSTDETSRATQRAFVSFTGISPNVALSNAQDRTKKQAQELTLNWLNSGATPAKDAVMVGSFEAWRGDLPQGFDFQDIAKVDSTSQIVIGPHQGTSMNIIVSIDNFRAQRAGTDRMFFWGWIAYRDIFPDSPARLTEFCTEMIQVAIDPKKDMEDITNTLAWNTQTCRHHNCYDQDCQDYPSRIKDAYPSQP